MIEYSREARKAFLLAVHFTSDKLGVTFESLKELESLARSLDFKVVGQEYQTRVSPDSNSYFGQGKLRKIKESIRNKAVDVILIDHDLSPNQGKYIETFLDCLVLDRTQLILEIFARHAQTQESKNQVELAQLKYMLPRLVGMWAHLDREKGGIGASKGTGEKQINIDRTLVRKRIDRLGKALAKIERERAVQSKKRSDCFQACIVGYTNAGKTSVMNALTGVHLPTENRLFATLDSTTRILDGAFSPQIVVSDTVGFIRNLPHNLVASFRSTLSVVKDADLLLHIVDASGSQIRQHIETTEGVLKEIESDHIPNFLVLNKIDRVTDKLDRLILAKTYPEAIAVSALDERGIDILKRKTVEYFQNQLIRQSTILPYHQANLLSKCYQLGKVEEVRYSEIHLALTQTNSRILRKMLAAIQSDERRNCGKSLFY